MVRPKRAVAATATAAPDDGENDGQEQQEAQAKRTGGTKRKATAKEPAVEPQRRRGGRVPGKKAAAAVAAAASAATPMDEDDVVNGHHLAGGAGNPPPNAEAAGPSHDPTTSSTPMVVDEVSRKRGRKAKVEADKKLKVARRRKHERGPGHVFVMGQNVVGQLGLGEDIIERRLPTFVPVVDATVEHDAKIVDICAGGMHNVCLTEDGQVFTFGCNDEGALGRDTSVEGSEGIPGRVDIPDGKMIVQASAGDSHTAVLTEDGQVFVWGNFKDDKGSMGLVSGGEKEDKPVRLNLRDEVVKISSGCDHLVLLTKEGAVLTLGIAEQGQLGRIGERFATRDGRKGSASMLTPSPVLYTKPGHKRLVFDNIWATAFATFARVKDTNQIYATGLNNYNQLGLGRMDRAVYFLEPVLSFNGPKWIEIAGDLHHTLALNEAGQVHAFGRKEYGRLGLGENAQDKDTPTVVPLLALVKCVDISCGTNTSFAVASNGAAYAWGMGSQNQLGNSDDKDRWQPCLIGGVQLLNRKIVGVSGGGQHTVLLSQSSSD